MRSILGRIRAHVQSFPTLVCFGVLKLDIVNATRPTRAPCRHRSGEARSAQKASCIYFGFESVRQRREESPRKNIDQRAEGEGVGQGGPR